MSRGKRTEKSAPKGERQPDAPATGPIAVKLLPRRRLFVVMCVIFALWVGFLVTLYFTTVHRG